jgi:syntaxin-binding protein 1
MFIVDRSMDPAAPLLHEFWYQAMVNDLLPVQDGVSYRSAVIPLCLANADDRLQV